MKRALIISAILNIVLIAVLGILCHKHLPLWRNAIFHGPPGEVHMPSGDVFPTNRWVSYDKEKIGSAVTIPIENDEGSIVHPDWRFMTQLKHDGLEYSEMTKLKTQYHEDGRAIVTQSKLRSDGAVEYWVIPEHAILGESKSAQ